MRGDEKGEVKSRGSFNNDVDRKRESWRLSKSWRRLSRCGLGFLNFVSVGLVTVGLVRVNDAAQINLVLLDSGGKCAALGLNLLQGALYLAVIYIHHGRRGGNRSSSRRKKQASCHQKRPETVTGVTDICLNTGVTLLLLG